MSTLRLDFVGQTLGNWQLQQKLGEGTFGAVYEAEHVAIVGRRAAVKVLHPHLAVNADIKRRFVNEASAASRAEHENIVQVFDGGVTTDEVCYVVMELLSGQSLAQLIHKGPVPPQRVINLGRQVASALSAAHDLHIVHRDLKPENILLVPRAQNPEFVKVLDFGSAKLRSDESHTRTGMWLGTPGYMSPEQWQTLPDIDARSDLYALGVILYECLTGTLPYTATTPFEWLSAHLNQPVPDPGRRVALPKGLAQLIMRLLAKRREDRPSSAVAVLQELERIDPHPGPLPQAGEGAARLPLPQAGEGRGEGRSEGAYRSSLRLGMGEMAQHVPRPKHKRAPLLVLLLGLSLACSLAGAAWLLYQAPSATKVPAQVVVSLPPPAEKPPAEKKALMEAPGWPAELIILGPARFSLGWGHGADAPDGPAHQAEVGRFAIARRETSLAEFREFAAAIGLPPGPWEDHRGADLPVRRVTRDEAERYCGWRHARFDGRLPTEEEWEFAAREGQPRRRFPFGEVFDRERVNAGRHPPVLLPTGSLPLSASPHGVLHLLGNVAEWTQSDAAPYPGSTAAFSPGAIVRGGGAATSPRDVNATARISVPPERRDPFIGVRCAATPP